MGEIKDRYCADSNPQRIYIDQEETSSPKVSTEFAMITTTINAKERRDIRTCNIPDIFIQTNLPSKGENELCTIMKIYGILI